MSINTQKILGVPGPGILPEHLEKVQLLSDQTGVALFLHGSRQTGFSVHNNLPFAKDADLDLGVIGGVKELIKVVRSDWAIIPHVEHAPMRIIATIKEALESGYVVIQPQKGRK